MMVPMMLKKPMVLTFHAVRKCRGGSHDRLGPAMLA
jgi:hypothetical protein